jgi:pilus assembly protein FimV
MYDQTADLLRNAIEHEPDRRDLRLKLLDVYFESGNRDEFLQLAEDLAHTRDQAAHGEWEKIAIMGRQIAPEDPLFADSDDMGVVAGVDLDLESGAEPQVVDYDLFGAGHADEPGVDATLDTPALELEAGALDEDSVETGFDYSDAPGRTTRQPHGQDLSLDAFELEVEPGTDGDATIVAGFDERSRRVMEAAAQRRSQQPEPAEEEQPTGGWEVPSFGTTPAHHGNADTTQLPALGREERRSEDDLDLGHYDLSDTANGPGLPYAATRALAEDDMALPDVEPVTMSEVGTKLDLARAYVDMGDPEGARNILEEVLGEGSMAQKQEAQRLLASLPGG